MSSTNVATTADDEPREQPGWRKGFWSLIVTQFQGAFSDNALKQLVVFLVLGMNLSTEQRDKLVPAVGALFALPFILFSMVGGFLADRYSKRTITIGVKCFEIAIMSLALLALSIKHLPLQLVCVFLMGVHSAIFGPSKYGLLPELVPGKKLSWGNGILELGTFLAIILGTVAAGILSEHFAGRHHLSGLALVALAVFGLVTSFSITKVPAANPTKKFNPNPLGDLITQLKIVRADRALWLALVGNIFFSFFGALALMNVAVFGKDLLHLSDSQNSYLTAALAIGIGLGSVSAGYLSGEKIEYGLIPLGAIGMTFGGAALAIPGLSYGAVAVALSLLGFFGGFFIVPVAALLQRRPDPAQKGGVLAAANLTSFIGIFAASGVYFVLVSVVKLSPGMIFMAAGLMTLGVTAYCLRLLPDSFGRLVLVFLTNTLYRVKVAGRDHVPRKGGALLVCNHLSFLDGLLVLAANERSIRFLMYQGDYDRAWVKPFARLMGVIPIASGHGPRDTIKALRTAAAAVEAGDLVCVFAEGEITRTGQMQPFRRGFHRIMKNTEAPIIPVCLEGVWGSIFSFADGKFFWKWPRQVPYPVKVSFGEPLPANAEPAKVQEAVRQLQVL